MKKILLLIILSPIALATEFTSTEAIEFIKKDIYKVTSLAAECVDFYTSKTGDSSFSIDLRERHNEECGGDPDTSPTITTVSIYKNITTNEISASKYDVLCNRYISFDELPQTDYNCPAKKYCVYPSGNEEYGGVIHEGHNNIDHECALKDRDEPYGDLIRSYIE